ncbi:receptor-interacting serine/threonine-protein kinase 3-like [Leptodactylus fuscus]|uniref:receptor-interacting serine/threonine-protein kinase 3-like n=1 Tax=Leptodactylus fuscus TaxID=238119 RepID=UPI003F4E4603
MQLLPPGDVEGLQRVGSGGFGVVYRGWSKKLNMEIALKMIQGSHGSNLKKIMKDLKRERDVMQKASNPYVLRLLGVYEKPDENLIEYGLVMEYMPYGSLRSLFDDISDVPWALRFQILHQVSIGMNYLHNLDPPIIHRDLKPCNVLLSKHLDVQITDFGLSKIVKSTTSVTPSFAGTLSYMAPEALKDINYYPTKSCDVYSYGILTWTVFSGEEPYPGVHAVVVQRLVSKGQRPKDSVLDQYRDVKMVPEAKDLMIRCWNQNPENRPSFHDCSESTAVMFKAYANEVVNAVRSTQDRLNNTSSQDQLSEASGTLENSSLAMDNLIRDLGNALPVDKGQEESRSTDVETRDRKDKNDDMARAAPSEVIRDDNNEMTPAEFTNSLMSEIMTMMAT